MRAAFPIAVALGLTGAWIPEALAQQALDHLDAAASCQRRAQTACALERADQALATLDAEGEPALRREALQIRAEALAQLDRPDDAKGAFEALLRHDPSWRPFSGADARVLAAFEAALPPSGTTPAAPAPPAVDADDVAPLVYAPERLTGIDLEAERRRDWRLGIGGGVALLMPEDQKLFLHGVAVAVDVTWQPEGLFGLWLQGTLSLHDFVEGLSLEPGWGKGLTTAAIVVGGVFTYPVLEDLDIFACAGVGPGFFGVRSLAEVIGLAVDAGVGLRYEIDESLSVRLDVMPSLKVPFGADMGPAFHINAFLRGESRF